MNSLITLITYTDWRLGTDENVN